MHTNSRLKVVGISVPIITITIIIRFGSGGYKHKDIQATLIDTY